VADRGASGKVRVRVLRFSPANYHPTNAIWISYVKFLFGSNKTSGFLI
jgi:hypothetical protein